MPFKKGQNRPWLKKKKEKTVDKPEIVTKPLQPTVAVESLEDRRERHEEPTKPPKDMSTAEIAATERYQAIHGNRWEHRAGSPLNPNRSQLQQIEPLLKAHLKVVFGKDFNIGWFIAADLGEREGEGWRVANIGDFPSDERNNPLWSDGIAMRYRMKNHADGTIRWGSTSKFFFCYIPTAKRLELKAAEKAAREAEYHKVVPKKEAKVFRDPEEFNANPNMMESIINTRQETASGGRVVR